MKSIRVLTQIAVLAAAFASGSASALVLLETSTTSTIVSHGASTQTGRLSRNGVQQDYDGGEAFPGIINPAVQYLYTTYAVNVGNAPYIQIDFDSISANTFVSAYQGFYAPNSTSTGNLGFDNRWLGDPGTSGNFFGGTDPLFFNVKAIPNQFLIVVVATTAAGGVGSTDPYHLIVEGFADRDFDDPITFRIPEPSTLLLLAPLALVVGLKSRKRRPAKAIA